jgi:hypothetical protein
LIASALIELAVTGAAPCQFKACGRFSFEWKPRSCSLELGNCDFTVGVTYFLWTFVSSPRNPKN